MTETNGAEPDAGTGSDAPGPAADPAPEQTPEQTSHRADPRYFRIGPAVMLAIAAVILVVDQVTKVIAVAALEGEQPVRIVGDTVRLLLLRNPGAAFSIGTAVTPILSIVACLVVVGLIWYSRRIHSRWWAWGLGLILGGAAGNLVDRFVRSPGVLRGHVVDFVSVGWWPVFNVADSCLVAGVIVVTVTVMLGVNNDGTRESDKSESEVSETDAESDQPAPGRRAADG